MRSVREYYDTVCGKLADDAWGRYMRDIHTRLYLYLVPRADGHSFEPTVAAESPSEGVVLAITEHIPRNMTREQLATWFRGCMGQLPIIPLDFDKGA